MMELFLTRGWLSTSLETHLISITILAVAGKPLVIGVADTIDLMSIPLAYYMPQIHSTGKKGKGSLIACRFQRSR